MREDRETHSSATAFGIFDLCVPYTGKVSSGGKYTWAKVQFLAPNTGPLFGWKIIFMRRAAACETVSVFLLD
jgi:hypothetical protein